MSERVKNALIIGLVAGFISGGASYAGMLWGRAEMKRWQDDWYAAHPVPRISPVIPVVCEPVCEPPEYLQYNAKKDEFTCAAAPPPKPVKQTKTRACMITINEKRIREISPNLNFPDDWGFVKQRCLANDGKWNLTNADGAGNCSFGCP